MNSSTISADIVSFTSLKYLSGMPYLTDADFPVSTNFSAGLFYNIRVAEETTREGVSLTYVGHGNPRLTDGPVVLHAHDWHASLAAVYLRRTVPTVRLEMDGHGVRYEAGRRRIEAAFRGAKCTDAYERMIERTIGSVRGARGRQQTA